MRDRVSLEGLEVGASVGVYPHEQGILQRLIIGVHAECDLSTAGTTDALEHAIDYDGLAAVCREVCGRGHHRLIEAIAEEIAGMLRERYGPRLGSIEVRVEKPGAVPDARSVAVCIRR